MNTAITVSHIERNPELLGQTVVVIGARNAAEKVKARGTLIFMGGTGGRRPGIRLGIASTVTTALPALTANLALELAPVRVNLFAAGFVDTQLSASLLGDEAALMPRE